MRRSALALALAVVASSPAALSAQHSAGFDTLAFAGLHYRMVGPYRGGRSTAVAGFPDDPDRWIMGSTGGGVWLSTDDGGSWTNISDAYFGGGIGAVRVAPSDPNVIYVGTGSADIRGNVSQGGGAWKSTDGGKTWTFIGLAEAGQISRIEVNPKDANLVYVAALGRPFGKNDDRGIFRSRDGGATWEHVLFVNDSTGASALSINPKNPRELYAGMWRGERKPWAIESGGMEGGVYKSSDGGDTWTKLHGGLPEGIVGKVGVTVSPANPDRVWAILEAEPEGGVYRSDDAGKTWTRTNSENKLRQRAWYYTHLLADPKDPNTVYALNTSVYRSIDGGKTFDVIPTPHGDTHDLWIHPDDTDRMIIADDGGAQVTVNGGRTWSSYYNQPTAELYDVVVDNQFPYRLYAAQQDNTTISVPAWMSSNTLYPKEHWENLGGCETGPVALHPDHPEITYAGCYGGVIDRYDHVKDQVRNMNQYPQLQLGSEAKDLKHRFQWVSPILVSKFDPNTVYHASQYVNRSRDGGVTWKTISPDLTTNDPAYQGKSGGPINADVTGVEIFEVVFSLAESPTDAKELWAGSDDGLVHVTRDDGATWKDITPKLMPTHGTVDEIELSTHAPGRAYMAVQAYRVDDFKPYIFRTDDWGASWRLLTDGANGIPADDPVRTVREDPVREGLLYAGTEHGIYASFDAGAHWQSIQRDLPMSPVTGIKIAHDDLILSTQGRSFWIMDDVTPLRELSREITASAAHLFKPRDAVRANMSGISGLSELGPEPPPQGATLHYWLGSKPSGSVRIDVVDASGTVAHTFASDSATVADTHGTKISADPGLHRIAWDLFYPGPELPPDAVEWGYTGGVKAPPGTYTVRMTVGAGAPEEQSLTVVGDPRLTDVTQADYEEQFKVGMQIRDSITAVTRAVDNLRAIRKQVEDVVSKAEAAGQATTLKPLGDTLRTKAKDVHEEMQQTLNKSGQDPIRFPPKLDNQFIELYNYVTGVDGYIAGGPEGRPTPGAYERLGDLNAGWAQVRTRYLGILQNELTRFNEAVQKLGLPAIVLPQKKKTIS